MFMDQLLGMPYHWRKSTKRKHDVTRCNNLNIRQNFVIKHKTQKAKTQRVNILFVYKEGVVSNRMCEAYFR